MSGKNRRPGSLWCLRRDFTSGYVCTTDDDGIAIYLNGYSNEMTMSRATARLLARRINECLNATVKR